MYTYDERDCENGVVTLKNYALQFYQLLHPAMDMSETGFAWLLGKLEWKIEFYHVSQSSMEKVFFFFPKCGEEEDGSKPKKQLDR